MMCSQIFWAFIIINFFNVNRIFEISHFSHYKVFHFVLKCGKVII